MIDEILGVLFPWRLMLPLAVGTAVTLLAACGSSPPPDREAEINRAVREAQVHEAIVFRAPCSEQARAAADAQCRSAHAVADGDLIARCEHSRRACARASDATGAHR